MSSYPTSEQLFVSEQNTNIPTRYQQDGLIGFVTENKVEPKIFEKMKIFTSHGKYSREPSKCISSLKTVISRVIPLVLEGRKARSKSHFSEKMILFSWNTGTFQRKSRYEKLLLNSSKKPPKRLWINSKIILFRFKFFFVNLNSFLFIIALINIFVAIFPFHTFWTFTLIWTRFIFTDWSKTTIVEPKFTFVNIDTLFIFIHFESSFTFALTPTRRFPTIRVFTTKWSFLTTTGETGPILIKLLDSNLIGSVKNHYDNFQNLQSEKLSKKTFIFDGWKYYIPAFGCHWIKICDVQVRLNSSLRASWRLSFAHESDQNWIFRLFIDSHVWLFDAFGDQSSNTSNLLHFKNDPKVSQEWFKNGPKLVQKFS